MRMLLGLLLAGVGAHAAPAQSPSSVMYGTAPSIERGRAQPEWLYWRQLSGAALSSPSEPAARAPRIAVRLDPADEEKLKSLFLAAKEASAAWPGFDFFAVPILLVQPGRSAILIGHPRPPKDFEPVPVAGRMVYVSKDPPDIGSDSRMDYPFHGAPVAALRSSAEDRADQAVPFAIHERFHQFQEGWKQRRPGAYKAEDAEDLALAAMEQDSLARALQARDDQALRDFIALRSFRYGRVEAQGVERREESREGMARFVDRRAAAETFDASMGVPSLVRSLREPLRLEQMGRWRLYATGAAMAYILDRRGGQWQEKMESGAGPYDLLAKDVAMTPEEASGRAESLKKTSAYAFALAAARAEIAAAKANRLEVLDHFQRPPGPWTLLTPVRAFLSGTRRWSRRAFQAPADLSAAPKLGLRLDDPLLANARL